MSFSFNWPLVGATILPNIGGWASAFMTRNEVATWYKTLNRPTWTPPDWAFGPVWTALYSGMGYASYLVWRDAGRQFGGPATLPLALFGSQLALNWAWTPIFFGMHNLKWGLIEISVLWGAAAATGIAFFQVNKTAGYIFIPYMVWLSLATALTNYIYTHNPPKAIEAKD